MDRELGKLVSSVRDDDHSFEVSRVYLFAASVNLMTCLYFVYQIILDVSQFTPEEISVKTTDRNIVIHGILTHFISLRMDYLLFICVQENTPSELTSTDTFHASQCLEILYLI